jgi:hypothetical protein
VAHTVRAAARRFWPLAALLAAPLAADLESASGLVVPGRWWMLPGALLAAGFALLAARWPVRAGLGLGVVLVAWSVVLRLVGAEVVASFGRLFAVEVVAVMTIVVRCGAGRAECGAACRYGRAWFPFRVYSIAPDV